MSVSISIELSDKDLEHFHAAQKAAQSTAGDKPTAEVIEAAGKLLKDAQKLTLPDFITERLLLLDTMIAMVRDEGFALPEADRDRVLAALVYFADPADAIPDHIPVLGFLDDAIMIELCVRSLQHELDAYEDFCDFREREAKQRGLDPASLGRADFLDSRREELIERMHVRRERDYGVGYGNSSGYGQTRRYTGASWRPSMFRVS